MTPRPAVVILDNNGRQRGEPAPVPPKRTPEKVRAAIQRTLAPGFVAVVTH